MDGYQVSPPLSKVESATVPPPPPTGKDIRPGSSATIPPASPPLTQPISSAPPPPPPPLPPMQTPLPQIPSASPTSPRSTSNKLLRVALIILSVVLVGAGVYAAMRFTQKTKAVTLTYWGLWEPESVVRPVLDEFEQSHPGIKVEYRMQSLTEYRERLKNALNSNLGPDIYRLHSSWVPMFKDNLLPVPANVYSTADFESVFYPAVKDTLRVGNNYMAIPLGYDGLSMFVNDDMLAQNGVSVPTNWYDLRKTAIAMSRCETEDGACRPGSRILASGAALGTTDNVDHWQDIIAVLMLQNRVSLAAPSDSPAEDVFEYYSSFNRILGIWDSTLPKSTVYFAQGKVGIYFGHSWRVFDIKAINPNLKYSIHPIPQLPVDLDKGEKPVAWSSFWVEGVNAKSRHPDESWRLLKYLSSPEVLTKLYNLAKANGREFGEPYSRRDMASLIQSDPLVGPFIQQAEIGRTWYIASATSDGANGLNTQLSNAFASVVKKENSVAGLAAQISQILGQHGIIVQ